MGANAQVVEQAYAAFGAGDIPGLLALLADDVEWTSPRTLPQGGEYHGPKGVLEFFEHVGAAWGGLGLVVESLNQAGDNVVGIVRVDGTLNGSANGYGAVQVFAVRDGKIRRFREYVDCDAVLS